MKSSPPHLAPPQAAFLFPSKVQSFGERIVLFVLNTIVFGRLERNLDDDDMFFLPHPAKEQAKIMWRDGSAVGFYSIKMKGEGRMACEVAGGLGHPGCLPVSGDPLGTSQSVDSSGSGSTAN